MSFARADALHRSAEFLALQRIGVRIQSAHFVLYAGKLEDRAGRSRLGITVSRRIGNAVVRNRVKRRVREIYRGSMRAAVPAGVSIVVIARAGAGLLPSESINRELTAAVRSLAARIKA